MRKTPFLTFDSYNLKNVDISRNKDSLFVYSTTALLGINSEVLTPEARTFYATLGNESIYSRHIKFSEPHHQKQSEITTASFSWMSLIPLWLALFAFVVMAIDRERQFL